jgi:YVTN family beta-propeller protein
MQACRRIAIRSAAVLGAVAVSIVGVARAETLLVVRKSAAALDFVDPGSGVRLATVQVGNAPHEVAVSPDGAVAVVSNYGTREAAGSSVSVIDVKHPRELRRIDLGAGARPHGVAWVGPDRVVVTSEGTGRLILLDPYAGRVLDRRLTEQQTSHMVAVDAATGTAYVANIGSGSVSAVSLPPKSQADASSTNIAPEIIATGSGSEGLALRPGVAELWVAARQDGSIAIVDTRTHAVVTRLPVPGVPIRVAFSADGARAYVTCAGSSEIAVFDANARRELARRKIDVPLAPGASNRPFAGLAPGSALPVGLAISADGRLVYVAATMADRIVVLDASTLQAGRTIAVEGEPDGLALTSVLPQAKCHACAAPPEPKPATDTTQ